MFRDPTDVVEALPFLRNVEIEEKNVTSFVTLDNSVHSGGELNESRSVIGWASDHPRPVN